MRRGGRALYALDASDPANPKFMWKKGCPNEDTNAGCDTDYAEIGQTWSDPSVMYLRKYGPDTPVLVVGVGYDADVEDVPPCLMTAASTTSVSTVSGGTVSYSLDGTCTVTGGTAETINRSKGRGVFLIDALNGELLWRFGPDASANSVVSGMSYSVAGKVVALNRDRDISRPVSGTENVIRGYTDRLYATDTGGNIWRIDVASADTAAWRVSKLASLGSGPLNSRKFLHRVDVVYTKDANGPYDAVLIGSGDREHPFDAVVNNRFYMIKDRNVAPTAPETAPATITESTLYDATANCVQQCTGDAQAAAEAALLAADGWYFDLRSGEKVVGAATTVAGTVFFSTNQPASNDCGTNLGIAREYQVSYQNAGAVRDLEPGNDLNVADRSSEHPGGGFPPEHQPFLIDFGTDAEQYEQGVISGTDVNRVDAVPFGARLRTFWHKRMD
jgi:type IV pilus assembly protein PilY1